MAALNRSAVFDAIRAHLEADTNDASGPRFLKVFATPPRALPPGGPYACFWYAGRRGKGKTFGNVMFTAVIQVMCFWPFQIERDTQESWGEDMWGADDSLCSRFRGDSTLGGTVADLEISDSRPGTFPVDQPVYATLEFELELDNLEGEAISA